jgi:hypothetical protein
MISKYATYDTNDSTVIAAAQRCPSAIWENNADYEST